jgi:3'-phosphoadenosine 5'-phosphosulfate sulfotransferase (PAPS reductase)/FAD synthetase
MTSTAPTGLSREQLDSYDAIIVAFSGGKDSLACLLDLLDRGAPKAKIELWHHDIDGREGSTLMDWPVTRDYCRKVADALGVRIYYSWRVGGFEREMGRNASATAPVAFETPDGVHFAGGAGDPGTRQKFPQVSADLSVRWCSSALKIDVCAAALRNQVRFDGKRVLVVTGERAEESAGRAKYATFEPDRTDLARRPTKRARKVAARLVDHWRPVHGWTEAQVWAAIRRHGVAPHPAYVLGWGRTSCAACIFGSANQWASLRAVNPEQFSAVATYEAKWGKTIQRKLNVVQQADKGSAYAFSEAERQMAVSVTFDAPVLVSPEEWVLPRGAFGESCGPT